jgi:hypothetical protein
LEFHLKHAIFENFSIFIRELWKREIDPNIRSAPVITRASTSIPIVFPDESQFRIQRDTYTSIARELECSTVIE